MDICIYRDHIPGVYTQFYFYAGQPATSDNAADALPYSNLQEKSFRRSSISKLAAQGASKLYSPNYVLNTLLLHAELETCSITTMLRAPMILTLLLSMVSLGIIYRAMIKQNSIDPGNYKWLGNVMFNTDKQKWIQIKNILFQQSPRLTYNNLETTISKSITQDDIATEGNDVFTSVSTTSKLLKTTDNKMYNHVNPSHVLGPGNGIIFLETGRRTQLPSLVLCAIESAARVYHDRPVVFFTNGLSENNSVSDEDPTQLRIPFLSSFPNIYVFPLKLEKVFKDTPLLPWYQKMNPKKEPYLVNNYSNGCRLALIWKYGGIYMDTDIISISPVQEGNFLTAQSPNVLNNAVFGLSTHHNFTWNSMENFVKNYKGYVWGNQGPYLFTRVLKKFCNISRLESVQDHVCGNVSYLQPQRYYPIPYPSWKKFYQKSDKLPTFNNSYALHIWNKMNQQKMTMVPGSKTLIEHLYKEQCPTIYGALARNEYIEN
ncbi:alpha-1,4-N-acetylglucosaminyltransferase-like [Pelobates fuscus]|uniref:alpha-1,4-N-acetylglucosaminyltransferase-like n=1 Tax=Pelobates fuscus TaxID=191477 RepID=UPI002FE47F99